MTFRCSLSSGFIRFFKQPGHQPSSDRHLLTVLRESAPGVELGAGGF